MTRSPTAASLAFLLVAALALPAAASGLNLGRLKGQGVVGEKADGYVAVVVAQSSAPIEAVVKSVNGRRRVVYEAIARKNSASVDAVALLAGTKLIARAPKGDWVTDADGVWRRK